MHVIGLMSGTSLDGVDACLVEIDGVGERLHWQMRHAATYAFPNGLRAAIEVQLNPETSRVDELAALDTWLAKTFADAASRCVADAGLEWAAIDLIGSHGQTLWHAPSGKHPATLQLGDGTMIAALTGVTTVSNFRPADVAKGGQGAPLVPYVDRLLFASLAGPGGLALQNMGGIGNVTWLPPLAQEDEAKAQRETPVIAFDTGPGNRLIDLAAAHVSGGIETCDRDGRRAIAGKVDESLVASWLASDKYLHLPPPKSTGREHYGPDFAARLFAEAERRGVRGDDLVATVTAFTEASVFDAYRRFLPTMPARVLVSGGGAANPTLLAWLGRRLAPAQVETTAAVGLHPDFKEALAFAILAYQTLAGTPNNLPDATGAAEPWVLGTIAPGRNFRRAILAPNTASVGTPAAVATESPNPLSRGLDTMAIADMVVAMHANDYDAVRAVGEAQRAIAALVAAIARAFRQGGRLFYVGAGTSGRLGVLDASECPPTFSADPSQVQGVLAGGDRALREAVEGAEDDADAGAVDMRARRVTATDVVVGISANGNAPYVQGALKAAHAVGATTALITCNPLRADAFTPDHIVELPTGPELVAGSTRLKAGTATKLTLNMLSTLSMVATGKVYDNLMVDVRVSNRKLQVRAERLVQHLTGLAPPEAAVLLAAAGGNVKKAAVMHHQQIDAPEAERRLVASGGFLRPWIPR